MKSKMHLVQICMMKNLYGVDLMSKLIIPVAFIGCIGGCIVGYAIKTNNVWLGIIGVFLIYITGVCCQYMYPVQKIFEYGGYQNV